MAEYFKEPQNPLKKIDEKTGDITYVYPMTTAKQVIMDDDGTRLNTILNENILYLGDAEDDMNVAPVDADTLGGVAAEEYATKEYVNSNGISTYIHSTGKLTGSGENGKFKATVSETVSSITINETACFVNCGGENSIELVKDVWYTFILDGATVNFKSGGGLSNSKLAEATASESDVLSGKTFYSGSKELKTGTLDYNISLLYSSTGNWVTRTYTTTKDYRAIVVFVNATEARGNSYHNASASGNGLSSLKTLTYSDEGARQGKTVIYSGKNIPTGTTITMAWCYEGSCSVIGFN